MAAALTLTLSLDRQGEGSEMDTEKESENSQTRRMTAKTLRGVIPGLSSRPIFKITHYLATAVVVVDLIGFLVGTAQDRRL